MTQYKGISFVLIEQKNRITLRFSESRCFLSTYYEFCCTNISKQTTVTVLVNFTTKKNNFLIQPLLQ